MSASASLTSGAAGRYATALFEIAKEAGKLEAVEADLDAVDQALSDSDDLRALISSPIYTRDEQGAAMTEISNKMGIGAEVANTMGLMAAKRRLFALPQMIRSVKALAANDRGEVSAEVTSAKALSEAQMTELSQVLKTSVGKDIKINATVDESLIGGLVVKVGSRMVDTSVRAKLAKLQNAMKEVG